MSTRAITANILLRAGIVGPASLTRALEAQARDGVSLIRALAVLGLADEEQVCAAIAEGLRIRYIDPTVDVEARAATELPLEFCRQRQVVPFALARGGLHLAMVGLTES